MHNFTKELYVFTDLPQPLPQPSFLSLPSALAVPHLLTAPLTYPRSHLPTQDHKPPESSKLFHFFWLQLFLQLLSLFVKRVVIFQGSFQETYPSLLDLPPPSCSYCFFCVCLLNALIDQFVFSKFVNKFIKF